jgi:hypothetical protein
MGQRKPNKCCATLTAAREGHWCSSLRRCRDVIGAQSTRRDATQQLILAKSQHRRSGGICCGGHGDNDRCAVPVGSNRNRGNLSEPWWVKKRKAGLGYVRIAKNSLRFTGSIPATRSRRPLQSTVLLLCGCLDGMHRYGNSLDMDRRTKGYGNGESNRIGRVENESVMKSCKGSSVGGMFAGRFGFGIPKKMYQARGG